MAYSDFENLWAFFEALGESKFHPETMKRGVEINGKWITVDKTHCIKLLRDKIPDLEEKKDSEILNDLRDPKKVNTYIVEAFKREQGLELAKSLAKRYSMMAAESRTDTMETTPSAPSEEQGSRGSSSGGGGGGGGGLPGRSSGSGAYSSPRFSYPAEQVQKPEIVTATSTGAIKEAGDPSKLVKAGSSGQVVEAGQPSKLVVSGTSPGDPSKLVIPGQGPGDPSKLVAAGSSGAIKEGPAKEFFITNKSGFITQIRGIKTPGFIKNFASNAQIFVKKNLNRIGQGLWGMGKNLTGNGGNLLGSVVGLSNKGISPYVKSFRMSGRLGSFRGSSFLSPKAGFGKKILLGLGGSFIVGFLGIGLIGGLFGLGGSSAGSGSSGAGSGNNFGLDYTLPLKDPSVAPQDIKSQVLAAFSGAKLEYWDTVVENSRNAGWNPALVLALWIEETGASHTTLIQNGGSEIPVNGKTSKGHLGCAPSEDQTISESLNCLFRMGSSFPNDQFPQFMAAYSGGPSGSPFSNNPNFPANIKVWYSRLVPQGLGAITPVITSGSCLNGNYKTCLLNQYKIDFQSGFSDTTMSMAYQALAASETVAAKFKSLILAACPTITVSPTSTVSYTQGCTVNFKTTSGKIAFIHELGHIIGNSNRPYFENLIAQAKLTDQNEWEGGSLTYYSKYASRPEDFSTVCYSYSTGENYLLDEEFAESVTYFINSNDSEVNSGTGCSVKWSDNPYQGGTRYQGHYNLMSGILK